jgi:Nucleotidyltransferase domain
LDEDVSVPMPEVAAFGNQVATVLGRLLGGEVVGVYFVGSVALGGYIPGESDIDIAAVAESALIGTQRQQVVMAIVELSAACPTRGLEFTLYRRDIAGSSPVGADFEVNANGGPVSCSSPR